MHIRESAGGEKMFSGERRRDLYGIFEGQDLVLKLDFLLFQMLQVHLLLRDIHARTRARARAQTHTHTHTHTAYMNQYNIER